GRVEVEGSRIAIRVGPVVRLIIAGISTVARYCAEFALALGYEVIVCDPDGAACAGCGGAGVRVEPERPALYIARPGSCQAATAVVATTHAPRSDDLAMMEAVRTPAFYIGVMGSRRTSEARAGRLRRAGGLGE